MDLTNLITICRNSGISWSFCCRDNPDASLDQGLKTANSEVLDSNLPCILVQPMWIQCYTQSTGTLPGEETHFLVPPLQGMCMGHHSFSGVNTFRWDSVPCSRCNKLCHGVCWELAWSSRCSVDLLYARLSQILKAGFWKRISSVWESPSVSLHILTWYGCLTPSLNICLSLSIVGLEKL